MPETLDCSSVYKSYIYQACYCKRGVAIKMGDALLLRPKIRNEQSERDSRKVRKKGQEKISLKKSRNLMAKVPECGWLQVIHSGRLRFATGHM